MADLIQHSNGRQPVPSGKKDGTQEGVDFRTPIPMNVIVNDGECPRVESTSTPREYAERKAGARNTNTPQKAAARPSRQSPGRPPQQPAPEKPRTTRKKATPAPQVSQPDEPGVSRPAVTPYDNAPIDKLIGVVEGLCERVDTTLAPQYTEDIQPDREHGEREFDEASDQHKGFPEEEVVFHLDKMVQTSRYHDVIVTPSIVVLVYNTSCRYGDRISLLPTGVENPIEIIAKGKTYQVGYLGMCFKDGDTEYTILVKSE